MLTPTKVISVILLAVAGSLCAIAEDTLKIKPSYYEVNDFVEDNETCLNCHGEIKYTLVDEANERSATKRMAPCKIVDRDKYYSGVHKSFACLDCHDYEYATFPHSMDSRFEENFLCMDCHGYDETYAHYHFETIETEFSESIHNIEDFNCWSCHDPHSYKAFMRNADDLEEAVMFDNNMCLRCHADYDRFSQKTEREEIVIVESHDWLPNQTAHFSSVRCIECHTEINDSILIAHKILPKEEAVELCTECHSKDTRLMHTLYKFQSLEERRGGFINGIMINDSYVIGANQNIILNRISFLVFGMTLLVIGFHAYLRIKKTKK
jgi:predicted CXXCH cytochrome family protein